MRNIALLEWGPASLFYIEPREKIKVRTEWVDGGPMMPPFFSIMEEAKINVTDICVRYALSAYLDLNGAIRNLRRCFGFPYQEYIGYLNTLTHGHRVRREHLHLIDRLRRWAIVSNIDAIFWIDYTKANQPPGSFKIGPRSSRPFHPNHLEFCGEAVMLRDQDGRDDAEEDSEMPWSELQDDKALGELGAVPALQSMSAGPSFLLSEGLGLRFPVAGAQPIKLQPFLKQPQRPPLPPQAAASQPQAAPPSAGHGAALALEGAEAEDSTRLAKRAPSKGRQATEDKATALLRGMIQEEVIPPHGSIYTRTITPGPGYYGLPEMKISPEKLEKETFTPRRKGVFDEVSLSARRMPGPGEYQPKQALADAGKRLGRFDQADKLLEPQEAFRKMPFISALASKMEFHGVNSPPVLYSGDGFADATQASYPEYSVGRARRLE